MKIRETRCSRKRMPTLHRKAWTVRKTDTGLSPAVAKWSRVTINFSGQWAIE
jgi:hypothetical protein